MDAFAPPLHCRITVSLRLHDRVRLPALPGSELRGLLRQGFAAAGLPPEPPETPAPFVVVPPWLGPREQPDAEIELPAGASLAFDCVLFGPPSAALGRLVAALEAVAAKPWLGRAPWRTAFSAEVLHALGPAPDGQAASAPRPLFQLAEPPAFAARVGWLSQHPRLLLTTTTPLALRRGKGLASGLDDAAALLLSLGARLQELTRAYGADPRLLPLAAPAPAELPLRDWQGDRRTFVRLGRGGRPLPLEGLDGTVVIEHPTPKALALLVAGEQLLVGRWTAFGLGQYGLAPAAADAAEVRA